MKNSHAMVAMLCELKVYADASRRCHQDVRKKVEASLHIKDVMYQSSCFSKITVINITLPSIH